MKGSLRRSIKSGQVGLREINVNISGTAATPEALGLDRLIVKEVIDNGVGSYTIVVLKPFHIDQKDGPMVQVTPLTAQISYHVSAVAHDRVTIECTDLAGAPADADISVRILGSDYKFVNK